jgi:hypothetical protein
MTNLLAVWSTIYNRLGDPAHQEHDYSAARADERVCSE